MNLTNLLSLKNISQYKLAKMSNVPQTTISDICLNKTSLEKCSGITLYNIASSLNISIEDLLLKQVDLISPQEFDVFKSSICHMVKENKPEQFIEKITTSDVVEKLFNDEEYAKCFYLIAMVDYLNKSINKKSDNSFDIYRKYSLYSPIYPASVILYDSIMDTNEHKKEAFKSSIPEFKRFNIIEKEIENVF